MTAPIPMPDPTLAAYAALSNAPTDTSLRARAAQDGAA